MEETTLSVRKIKKMREVTLDRGLSAPEELYYMIRHKGANITVVPPYRLGREYPKTYGHFHQPEMAESYEILLGEAAILIQKGTDPVEEIKLVKLKKGDSFTVPKGHAHSLINLGGGPLVTLDNSNQERCKNFYDPIRAKRGFAYYIVDEGGKIKAIPNPSYKGTPHLEFNG